MYDTDPAKNLYPRDTSLYTNGRKTKMAAVTASLYSPPASPPKKKKNIY